ncbi:MAG TPA: hypothetical protein VJX67_22600 [Blastocatellia bacterium]|nr:hypothetical protein [Blastocatellia bacterium]
MANCILCNNRPGKRYCPALKAKICAICCARGRMIDIACTEDCTFLRAGRENATNKAKEMASKGGAMLTKRSPLNEAQELTIVLAGDAIVKLQRKELPDMVDTEVLEALDNAARNLDTADSGLIYEHQHSSPRIQQLSKAIRRRIEEVNLELGPDEQLTRLDVTTGLDFLKEIVSIHIRHGDDERSYIRYTAHHIPWGEKAKSDKLVIAER